MDIFGIGMLELLLIVLVAFISIGPQRLIEASRKAGNYVGRWSRYIADINSKIQSERKNNKSL